MQADAKDELAEFIETEFGSLDDYPEIMKTFIQDIVNQTNADFAAAEEIDDIVNILLATKKTLIATEPIASQNPETIEEVKASAKSAVNDYATAYNYQADKQTEINSFVSDANDKIDGSDEILEIVSSFDELKDNVNQVFILVNVVAKDLFISEYASGEGFDRYLEIYNGTDNVVDLSKYALRIFPSGVSGPINDSTIVPLNGSLGTNQTLVIAHENAGSAIAEKADLSSSIACSFDGNDAIALVKKNSFNNWEIIDLFGTILNTGPLNAGISEDSISYEDFKVFGDKIYLLDARHLYKETVIINEMPVEVQGRSCIFVINSEMKWETVYDEFVITDYVKAKLDAFYRFTTPLA